MAQNVSCGQRKKRRKRLPFGFRTQYRVAVFITMIIPRDKGRFWLNIPPLQKIDPFLHSITTAQLYSPFSLLVHPLLHVCILPPFRSHFPSLLISFSLPFVLILPPFRSHSPSPRAYSPSLSHILSFASFSSRHRFWSPQKCTPRARTQSTTAFKGSGFRQNTVRRSKNTCLTPLRHLKSTI